MPWSGSSAVKNMQRSFQSGGQLLVGKPGKIVEPDWERRRIRHLIFGADAIVRRSSNAVTHRFAKEPSCDRVIRRLLQIVASHLHARMQVDCRCDLFGAVSRRSGEGDRAARRDDPVCACGAAPSSRQQGKE